MSLSIKAEAMPGSDFKDVIKQARDMSENIGCFIEFDFNSVKVICGPDADPETGHEKFLRILRSDIKHKYMRA